MFQVQKLTMNIVDILQQLKCNTFSLMCFNILGLSMTEASEPVMKVEHMKHEGIIGQSNCHELEVISLLFCFFFVCNLFF